VDPDAPFDLAQNDRIQGAAVDLGCYESSITTGITDMVATAPKALYYDAAQGEVVFFQPAGMHNGEYRVFSSNGQLVAQGRRAGDRVRLSVGAGIHVYVEEGGALLRFWVP
jgi:hypothetical protein